MGYHRIRSYILVYYLLTGLLLATLPAKMVAGNSYRTDLLESMARKMQVISLLDTLPDGLYTNISTFRGRPVTVEVDGNRICHIGYSVFSKEQRDVFGSVICNFLERYLLELEIPIREEVTADVRMKEDEVKIWKGTINMLPSLCADSTVGINVQTINERGYTIEWRQNEQQLFVLSFPIDYYLLFGTDMDECERRLPQEIRRDTIQEVPQQLPLRGQLQKAWQTNYYTQKGEHYHLASLSSNHYFQENDEGSFQPIYNRSYPLESLANLLTTDFVNNDFILDIRLRKYGFKTDTLSVPLNQWLRYCRHTGCKPYFGVISLEERGNAVCELIMHNATMGYNHIMKLTIPLALLEERKGHIDARLNSYVTFTRIKSLFGEE